MTEEKMRKKLFSSILVFCMLFCSLVITMPINAAAASSADVVQTAIGLCGKYPYVWGGRSPSDGGFDCSGLVYHVYHTCLGYNITYDQIYSRSIPGTKINGKENLMPGDIIFGLNNQGGGHTGIYIGNNQMVHSGSKGICKTSINGTWFTFQFAIRPNGTNQSSTSTQVNVLPTKLMVSTDKSSYLVGETVKVTPSANNATHYAISIWLGAFKTGERLYVNYKLYGGIDFNPPRPGTYTIRVDAKNALGYISKETTFNVKDKETPITSTVTLDANGGNVSPTSITVRQGNTYNSLPTPTRSGYTFDGWYTAANGGTQIISSTPVNLSSNQSTIYAHWVKDISMDFTIETGLWDITIPANCPVTYYAGPSSMVVTHYEPEADSAYRNVNFKKRAVFADGTIRFSFAEDKWFVLTSAMIVEDRMNPTYTVTLNANGGNVSPSTITVKKGGTYGTLPQPTWSTSNSYDFDGWFTAANGGIRIEATNVLWEDADHTLYAHWINIHEAILDPNGGTVSGSSSPIKTEYKDGMYLPSATRPGYTFDGWYTERTGGEKVTSGWIRFKGGAHFYAHWTPVAKGNYTITFDSLGGERPSPASIEVQEGGTYGTLPIVFGPTFGSTLIGWFTAPTGGRQVLSGDPLITNADHTLYAHYRKNLYTITFDPNGGTVARQFSGEMSSYPEEYIVGAKANGYDEDLPKAAWAGHEFLGWFTAPVGGVQVVKGDQYVVQDDHTLYAHWK